MSASRSGSGPGPPGRPPNGPPGPPPPQGPPPPGAAAGRLPPEPPPDPHGLGPPLFEDMRTFLCDLAARNRRWRIQAPCAISSHGRHHGGLFIVRRQEVCKQMANGTDVRRPARRTARDRRSRLRQGYRAAGLVEGIELRGSLVQVALLTDRAHAEAMEPVRRAVEALLARQPGDHQCHRGADRAQGAGAGAARGGGRARAWPRTEAAAAAAGREGDRRGGVGQGRRRQVDRRGQSGGVAGAGRAPRSGCWTPISTGRACRACWGCRASRRCGRRR